MVVFDGSLRGKPLLYVIISYLLLVLAQEDSHRPDVIDSRYKLKCSFENANGALKINKQITVYLFDKKTKVYYFENDETYEHTLSVTLTPCSSRVKWSFLYESCNGTGKRNEAELGANKVKENIGEGEDNEMRTVIAEKARRGCYFLELTPLEGNTKINVYLTMDNGGPFELKFSQTANLTLIPQKKQRLKITWARSLINPHNTSYCIVVSRKREYQALCAAEEEGDIVSNFKESAWVNMNSLEKVHMGKWENLTSVQKRKTPKNTVIICVDQKLQLTLTKMKEKLYYFNLFAINYKTNFTVPYGKSLINYNYKERPITLINGKRRIIDLKKHSGEVYLKFKAFKRTKEIQFYVLVCGGAVEAEFTRKDRNDKKSKTDWTWENSTRVFGYKKFTFKIPGEYLLRIRAPDTDEWARVEYVEVFATMNLVKYPLPALPRELSIYEYQSRKKCNSITIGWIPEPDDTVNKYCVTVRENRRIDYADKFRASFQCYLDGRSGKGFSSFPQKYGKKLYVYRKCRKQTTTQKISITTHTITNLKPGKSYTIQVTVEKENGRTLSYKLLKAVTKHSCKA